MSAFSWHFHFYKPRLANLSLKACRTCFKGLDIDGRMWQDVAGWSGTTVPHNQPIATFKLTLALGTIAETVTQNKGSHADQGFRTSRCCQPLLEPWVINNLGKKKEYYSSRTAKPFHRVANMSRPDPLPFHIETKHISIFKLWFCYGEGLKMGVTTYCLFLLGPFANLYIQRIFTPNTIHYAKSNSALQFIFLGCAFDMSASPHNTSCQGCHGLYCGWEPALKFFWFASCHRKAHEQESTVISCWHHLCDMIMIPPNPQTWDGKRSIHTAISL